MRQFPQPRIVVSKCLGFAACRFSGQSAPDRFVERLRPVAELVPFCPEEAIGLTGERQSLKLRLSTQGPLLVDPASGENLSDKVTSASKAFINSLGPVDAFILKSRCPTCGPRDISVYDGDSRLTSERGIGPFAAVASSECPFAAIEDEGRLTNFRLREHYLTHVYALADFRRMAANTKSMNDVIQFHSRHKLQLMACSERDMRELGRLVANKEQLPIQDVVAKYGLMMGQAFKRVPRYTSNINVLMHVLGYFKNLSSKERNHFLEQLEEYRNQRIPLSVPLTIARTWVHAFNVRYLEDQTFFEPYPQDLADLQDSGRGRPLNPGR